MTDEEATKIYENMKEYFTKDMPNPEQEPIRFSHYMKLFKFYMDRGDFNKKNAGDQT